MIRTQIQLTEEQAAKAKRLAAARGVSVAELFRDLLGAAPERDDRIARWERSLAVLGTFHDVEGKTDVSVNHDEYFVRSLEEELER